MLVTETEREQFFGLIKKTREWFKQYPVTASIKTLEQYRSAYERMKKDSATPLDKARKSKKSFYFYRAALIACTVQDAYKATCDAVSAFKAGDIVRSHKYFGQLIAYAKVINENKPDPHHQRKNLGEKGQWATYAENEGITPCRHTKNLTLRTLPQDWRSQIWEKIRVNSQYRLPIAVLACSGCRPGELEHGVEVERVVEGIRFTVKGIKTHGGKYGQDERTITIAIESLEAKFLEDVLAEGGGPIQVKARARPLKDAIRRISKRVWHKKCKEKEKEKEKESCTDHVSPYCYRHQFASDVKAHGMPIEEIAKALGHSVDDTQRLYGHIRRGRGGGNRVIKVTASREVRKTWRDPPKSGRKSGSKPGRKKP